MKPHAFAFVILAYIGILAGCTTTSVPEQQKQQIKKIALISLFPPEIDIHQLGILPVSHDSRVEQTQEWDAQEATLSIAGRLLRERGYETIPLDARASLLPLPALPIPQDILPAYLSASREKGADAIVVLAPHRMSSNGPSFHSVYFLPSRLFGIKSVFGGCVTAVYVFSPDGTLIAHSIDNESFKDMPGIPWREDWSGYSKTERQAIYAQLEKLLEENLRWKISKIL